MSENELEQLKKRLLEDYRANGGRKDISSLSAPQILNEIDHLKEITKLRDQITTLQQAGAVKDHIQPIQAFGRVNDAKNNAALAREAANVFGQYLDYIDPPFDERVLEDESYARDNDLGKLAEPGKENTVVILRDKEGRCI